MIFAASQVPLFYVDSAGALVELVDLYPTIAELAGFQLPEGKHVEDIFDKPKKTRTKRTTKVSQKTEKSS